MVNTETQIGSRIRPRKVFFKTSKIRLLHVSIGGNIDKETEEVRDEQNWTQINCPLNSSTLIVYAALWHLNLIKFLPTLVDLIFLLSLVQVPENQQKSAIVILHITVINS